MTVLTDVSSKEVLNVHLSFLTWFLKEASVTELLMCILSLDHIKEPVYLDNIYSLFKQNMKSCNAKRRRHATPENGEKQQWI